MSVFHLEQFDRVEEIRASAAAWDDLWRRGEVTIPTARAELVAEWVEAFAPAARLRALVVRRGEVMVAALPLVGRRVGGVLPVGGTTVNYWSPNGELLLDPTGDTEAILDLLIDGIEQLQWPLLWIEMAPAASSHWTAMIGALRRRGLAVDVHPRWRVGLVNTEGDFDEYLASRSKNLRRSLGKDRRRLEQGGAARFRFDAPTVDQVEARLREVFELEDRGWKGEAGGSVLRAPGMFEFYARQARRLAAWGDLSVAVLEHRGVPIAFDVGWLGKEVYHSYKVGYDPAYRGFGSGHLLRGELIRHCFEHPAIRAVDFQGPQTEALSAWSTDSYPISRLVVAPRRWTSRALWHGYRLLARAVRRLRRRREPW
jgi:CelD/BcsL family acetyltransferase involved in cellulose biosynthesis